MERKRSVSPVKSEKRQGKENNFTMSNQNFRDTNSVKKRLMDKKCYNKEEQSISTPTKWINKRLTFGVMDSWQKSPTKIQKKKQIIITDLPQTLHYLIFSFLQPLEIVRSLSLVCSTFNQVTMDNRLWSFLSQNKQLTVNEKYNKLQCIVERRSKGRLFKAISRIDNGKVMIRRVNIVISNAGQDDGIPTSILREISYISFLQHENVQKIKEVEVDGEVVQIVSEQCEMNLKEYMKKFLKPAPLKEADFIEGQVIEKNNNMEYKIPLSHVKKIAFQILKGLNYLHHKGMMHRNMKPDNILINENLDVKIADFALSKYAQVPHINYTPEDPKDRERSGREARRLWYRPPDILLRKQFYSYEIDMWSFGCILAELATNQPLFDGQSEIEQLFKIFRLIGSPDQETFKSISETEYTFTFPHWEGVPISYAAYPKTSEKFHQINLKLVKNREASLRKLRQISKVLQVEGMDLLEKILQFEPQKRITAEQALLHPFFKEFQKVDICENPAFTHSNIPDCHIDAYMNGMREREIDLICDYQYLNTQPFITEQMRCILVDWLIDVSIHFEVWDETLHLAVSYIDRVLSQLKVEKRKLQLIGVTCMKIADVFNERSKEYYKQDNAHEYAYITADEYSTRELVETEKVLLDILDFKLNSATTMQFLKLYIKKLKIEDQNVTLLAMYLSDMMLLVYESLQFPYSLLAFACLFMSCTYYDHQIPEDVQIKQFQFYTKQQFKKCVKFIKDTWTSFTVGATFINYETIYSKYQHCYNFETKSLQVPVFNNQKVEDWIFLE